MTTTDRRWRSLDDDPPPEHARVLLTNNLAATNGFGQMSHLWIGWPQRSSGPTESFPDIPPKGTWMAYTECDRIVQNLTHWLPLPTVAGWPR